MMQTVLSLGRVNWHLSQISSHRLLSAPRSTCSTRSPYINAPSSEAALRRNERSPISLTWRNGACLGRPYGAAIRSCYRSSRQPNGIWKSSQARTASRRYSISPVKPYRKTKRNLVHAAPAGGFAWSAEPPNAIHDTESALAEIPKNSACFSLYAASQGLSMEPLVPLPASTLPASLPSPATQLRSKGRATEPIAYVMRHGI